ncbi:MAG: carbohydrate ABC transporter permease [Acholeplasmataceae bacterium]|nr:carbohydrate ABC transporter permease [Acholeplasmataceae bacterium]
MFKRLTKNRFKYQKKLIGNSKENGLLYNLFIYFLLIVIGFVFLYPIIYMLSTSLMSNLDLVNFKIKWFPSKIYFENYLIAYKALALPKSVFTTIFVSLVATITMIISSSLIGFGLGRFDFPGKKIVFILLIFSYIMPKTLFLIPTYQIYTKLKLRNSILGLIIPILLGQGIQGAFFIFIFYQFFKMIPKDLEEAAIIDGASSFKFFYKVAIKMAMPALVIAFVFSFSLYWNEINLYSIYMNGQYKTLPMLLGNLRDLYYSEATGNTQIDPNLRFSEAKAYAGTLISIVVPIIIFSIVQKWFVESIDKSGITG